MNLSADSAHSNTLRRCFFCILLMLVGTFTFLDYWAESGDFHAKPSTILDLANGTGPAPAQYRVGIIMTARQIIRLSHGHVAYRHLFAAFDLVFALLAGVLMFWTLERSQAFAAASFPSRCLRAVLALGLTGYYLWWSLWFLRPETWASALFVVATLYLLSRARSAALVIGCMAVLSLLQGFLRADVAIIFDAAIFAYAALRGQKSFLIGRGALLAAAGISCGIAGAVQWLLMHRIFPHATYGDIPVIQLFWNLRPLQFFPFLLFIVPTVFTFLRGRERDAVGAAQAHSLLLACVVYFLIWSVVGKLDEVRIFVPFAFALIPQTANAFASRLEESSHKTQAA